MPTHLLTAAFLFLLIGAGCSDPPGDVDYIEHFRAHRAEFEELARLAPNCENVSLLPTASLPASAEERRCGELLGALDLESMSSMTTRYPHPSYGSTGLMVWLRSAGWGWERGYFRADTLWLPTYDSLDGPIRETGIPPYGTGFRPIVDDWYLTRFNPQDGPQTPGRD